MNDNIIWKDIPNWENVYQYNQFGQIRSLQRPKIKLLKPQKVNGYLSYVIRNKTRRERVYAHRLIAESIPNPLSLPFVNHKNGNRSDNRIENLEWVSPRGNFIHGRDVLGTITIGTQKAKPKGVCLINGCDRMAYCKAMCRFHYDKQLKMLKERKNKMVQ